RTRTAACRRCPARGPSWPHSAASSPTTVRHASRRSTTEPAGSRRWPRPRSASAFAGLLPRAGAQLVPARNGLQHEPDRLQVLGATGLRDRVVPLGSLRQPARILERLARLPGVRARRAHRVVGGAGGILLAERVGGREGEGVHLCGRRGSVLAAAESALTLAQRLLEAGEALALGRAHEAGGALVAAIPREERAPGAQPADVVLTGTVGVRRAALPVVHVHALPRDRVDAVVGAGVEVIAPPCGQGVDDAALRQALVGAAVGVDVVAVVALLRAFPDAVATPRCGRGDAERASQREY